MYRALTRAKELEQHAKITEMLYNVKDWLRQQLENPKSKKVQNTFPATKQLSLEVSVTKGKKPGVSLNYTLFRNKKSILTNEVKITEDSHFTLHIMGPVRENINNAIKGD